MEPFKNAISPAVIDITADILQRVEPTYDRKRFADLAADGLSSLELKERVLQFAHALDATLPVDFSAAAEILIKSLHPSEDTDRDNIEFGPEGVCGFAGWPLTEWVAIRAHDHATPDAALGVLKEMTKRFSAEFAVRPFLDKHTEASLKIFQEWTQDENRHVRRLASEGARPRLPWGIRLQKFIEKPNLILPILEALKDDPEEYVRRSVANNLNDIAKDHPDMVADIAVDWLENATRDRQRLVKHACRTLIKQGHGRALEAFGYFPVEPSSAALNILTPTVNYGNALEFEFSLDGLPKGTGLMIDYAIHFVKANGTRTAKVFKWKDLKSAGDSLTATRQHAIKPITTRVYYPGEHMIEVMVNGRSVAQAEFTLIMP